MKRLYEQIYHDLRKKIESQTLQAGDLLPSENELERIYQVSRAPVRQALGLLEQEKRIIRMPGRGTFVAIPSDQASEWFRISPFIKQIERDWNRMECKTLLIEAVCPPEEVRNFFQLSPEDQVTHVYRLRLVDRQPVILSHHYLPDTTHIEALQKEGDFLSLFHVVEKLYHTEYTRMEDTLWAIMAEEEVANPMNIPVGFPLIRSCRRSYAEKMPILYDFFYVRTDIWSYTSVSQKNILD